MVEGSPGDADVDETEIEEADPVPLGEAPGGEEAPGDMDVTRPEEREIAGEAARERSDFLALMGHFYRGSMARANTWRDRLDKTSNWAVVIVASLLTVAFSGERPHAVLLVGILVVSIFMFIEARRYRMFDVWRSRLRILEEDVFANALEPSGVEQREWRALLSQDLRHPTIKITFFEALARRLRRIYLALLVILLLGWFARLSLSGPGVQSAVSEASIWVIPGEIVAGVVLAYYLGLIVVAVWPMKREAKGELRYDPEADRWHQKRS